MKHRLLFLSCLSVILVALAGCSKDEGSDTPLYQNDTIKYDANRKILIAYFSWGGNIWGIERSVFFNGREKWAKGFENQRV